MVVSCEDIVSTHWTHHQSKKQHCWERWKSKCSGYPIHARNTGDEKAFATVQHPNTQAHTHTKWQNRRIPGRFMPSPRQHSSFINLSHERRIKKNNNKWLHLITIWSRQQPHLLRCTPTVMKKKKRERERDSQQRWVGRFIIENNVNTQCAITMETAKCESYTIFLLYFVQTDKNTTFINTLLSTWCTFEVCNVCFMSVHV